MEISLEPYICILKRYLGENLFIPCRGIVIAGNSSLECFFEGLLKGNISLTVKRLYFISPPIIRRLFPKSVLEINFFIHFQKQYSFRLGEIWNICFCSLKIWRFFTIVFLLKLQHPEGPFLFQTHKYTKELKTWQKWIKITNLIIDSASRYI